MQTNKKLILIVVSVIIGAISIFFLYRLYKTHNAIKYAVAQSSVLSITGFDYQNTLSKLHNLSIISALENDPSINILQSNDFLNLELAHAPGFKEVIKNRRHVLSFKVGTKNQLQSILAIEGNREIYDKLIQEIKGDEYVFSRYSSPSGDILEAYNIKKQKELVISFAYGVIVITNEALYAEETLKCIRKRILLFEKADFNFSANYIYLKQNALQRWVENLTKNNISEFYKWFEMVDECEFKLNDEGTLANGNFYFYDIKNKLQSSTESQPFYLEKWLQNITSNFVAFHPITENSEIRLKEVYRCYTNLQDENISNNTFVIAYSELDSIALQNIFSKHSIEQYSVFNKYKVYKFGKYPFFKNFCNSTTPDLPESYVTMLSLNVFVVASSAASLIPLLQKAKNNEVEVKNSNASVLLMQVQPQHLLPYYSKIIKDEYRRNVLEATFLQKLEFVQFQLDTIVKNKGIGTIFFNKNATRNAVSLELIWSKSLETETKNIEILKSKKDGENLILYQDEKNILHCFNFKAKELWQRFILGKISSKITAVDLYKDGNHHFFFNTSNQIYLLNDKGEDMKNFPKQIYNEGFRGMYLFDMGDKYEYFFVQNNFIYGFDYSGASLKDWRPRESPYRIDFELIHFIKRNKNYVVGVNQRGKVFFWNRFGKRVERDIDFNRQISKNFVILPAINKKYRSELISVDTSGQVMSVMLDSLQKKEYKFKLTSKGGGHFITQNRDSTFQKIIYQNGSKLLFFDRYTQKTDTLTLEKNFKLKGVLNCNEKTSFIILSNNITCSIISSHKKVVAERVEGEIIGIVEDQIAGNYYIVTLDQLKRVNLYKFLM